MRRLKFDFVFATQFRKARGSGLFAVKSSNKKRIKSIKKIIGRVDWRRDVRKEKLKLPVHDLFPCFMKTKEKKGNAIK